MLTPTTIRYFELQGATGAAQELTVLDVNGDGYLDLVGASLYYPLQNKEIPVFVLLNDKQGGFKTGPTSLFSGGVPGTVHPREMVTGDFNGDGRTDIFIADHGYDVNPFPGHANTLLLGKAGGGFTNATARLPSTPDFSHSADAADIDNDGDLDLFVGNIGGGQAGPYFLINDGSAKFSLSTVRLPAEVAQRQNTYTTSLFFDADGDGDKDLFLGSETTGHALLLNNGKGSFTKSAKTMPDGLFGANQSITIDSKGFDFNRDGRMDVLAVETDKDPFYKGARLQALISDGKGGFTDGTSAYFDSQPSTEGWVKYVQFIDLNRDGALDIVGEISGGYMGLVAYINDGANHFYQLRGDALVSSYSNPIEFMDVDKDGTPELVQAGTYDGKYGISVIDIKLSTSNVVGTSGHDTVFGSAASQTINGGAGNDFLAGGDGNDTLIGGAGADKLLGGAGTDTASYAGATKGVTAALDNPALNTNDAKGDIYSSIENLTGSSYDDILYGNSGNNTMSGGAGRNTLNGGAGNDIFIGGAGQDLINGGAGTDTVTYSGSAKGVNASLAAPSTNTNDAQGDTYSGIENLAGTAFADRLQGNGLGNTLNGREGDDKLIGGVGKDLLIGGAGKDVFVFNVSFTESSIDTIDDFSAKDDTIWLDKDIFYNVGAVGHLSAAAFYTGTAAHDASDRIIYDKTTGSLWYDRDGTGSYEARQFAILDKGLSITAADFDIIA